jgi:hypothetical protein
MSSILGVDTDPSVFLGVWTNWSRGQVLGSTLTMTQRNGSVLVAFVALFITFVGARLWRIACVAIHHSQSSAEPQDGIYHQGQAILKNADNPLAGFLSWYGLLMAWRKIGHRPYHRLLPMTLLALVLGIGFIAASLLSSRVGSAMGEEVLVRGTCGVNILGHYIAGQDKNPAVETSPEFFTVLIPFLGQRLVSFSNYALSCYTQKGTSQGCNTYVKSQLPFTSNHSAACPFQDDMCRLSNSNILIDTGYIDSHKDLGMNAQPEDRFLYRRTTHCAPLVSESYTSSINYNSSGAQVPYIQYNYGANGPVQQARAGNVTYVYPQTLPKDRFQSGKASLIPEYTLGYNYVNVINGSISASRGFTPIPEIQRTDADVSLFFLSSNTVTSPVPINDPWYASHQTVPGYRLNFNGWGNLSVGAYFADETASVLGCAKQYQICLPGTPNKCSRMGGKQELSYLLESLAPSEQQLARIKWSIMAALTGNELDGFVQTLGASSLSSKHSLVSGVQGPLPDDQWQKDVEHWHAATLVAMQGSAVDSAMGPSGGEMKKRFWPGPENEAERSGCRNQVCFSQYYAHVLQLTNTIVLENPLLRTFKFQRLWTRIHFRRRRNHHHPPLPPRVPACFCQETPQRQARILTARVVQQRYASTSAHGARGTRYGRVEQVYRRCTGHEERRNARRPKSWRERAS